MMLRNRSCSGGLSCLRRAKRLFQTKGFWAGGLVVALSLVSVPAADVDEFDSLYYEGENWFFRLGARPLFGVKGTVERDYPTSQKTYDNGFVKPDISGPDSQTTWNWGYHQDSQISGNRLWLTRQRGEPVAGFFSDEGNDPSMGLEAMGGIEMFWFELKGRPARVGFELGYDYNLFSVENQSTAASRTTLHADAYDLGNTVPPGAPYWGTKQGPGPLIDLYPSISTAISSPSQTFFDGELEANLHTVKIGFWFEYLLNRRIAMSASLGYASVYADTRLIYTESLYFADPRLLDQPPTQNTIGGRAWHPGAYLQLRCQYRVTPHLGAYLGGEFQYNTKHEFSEAERTVTLNLGPTVAVSGGLEVRF